MEQSKEGERIGNDVREVKRETHQLFWVLKIIVRTLAFTLCEMRNYRGLLSRGRAQRDLPVKKDQSDYCFETRPQGGKMEARPFRILFQ